jgi:polyphosphate kinase
VTVEIWVRGICSLKPGIPGVSENITVRSILGRYLEHSRIFSFQNGGDPVTFIGSADMMHRNLDRRVEALVRLKRPEHLAELERLFDQAMSDETASWHLDDIGVWDRFSVGEDGEPLVDLQVATQQALSTRKRQAR